MDTHGPVIPVPNKSNKSCLDPNPERYTPTTMAASLDQTVRQYLATKSAVDEATKALKILEDNIKSEFIGREINRYELDGHSLCLVQAERRSFDAEALKALINASVFRKVTTVEVRTTLIDAAVSMGQISPEIVEQVTKKTPYTQIRVS